MQRRAESLLIDCNVIIGVYDNHIKIDEVTEHNLVVTSGRNLVRDLLNSSGPSFITRLAVGTNNTAVSSTQTALLAEVFRDQITQRITSDGLLRLKYFLASTSVNGNTLREAGLFNASSGGVMFARVTHGDIVKTSSISLTYDWSINIGAS